MTVYTPTELLEDHADDHDEDVMDRAFALAEADDQIERGVHPKGVAAAALYAAYLETRPREQSGEGRPTQKDVAEQFGTNQVTLRKRFRDLPEVDG